MITIGKAIYTLLISDEILTGYTGNRIYPLILPAETSLPCIVFERRSTPEQNKDNTKIFTTTVEITIMSADYSESIDIALAVQNILENYSGTIGETIIRDIMLTGIDEIYADDAFIQKLTFEVKGL